MKNYRRLKKQRIKEDVIIGFFNCFHLGHMKLLDNKKASIITFKSTPSKSHDILLFKQKIKFLKKMGFKNIYVFNIARNNMSAKMFYDRYLIDAKSIIAGDDCKIGNDHQLIKSLSPQKQIKLIKYKKQFSSSKVKKLLMAGKVELANKLLFEKYSITARVKRGNKKGRIIGFRTANFYFKKHMPIVENGIYISQTVYHQKVYQSVSFWGIPKTIRNKNVPVMETHILDFNQNIYFKNIKIILLKKIANIQKYNSISELQNVIMEYIRMSKSYSSQL